MNASVNSSRLGPTQNVSRARKLIRILAVSVIVLIGILVIAVGSHPANKDYISYWSAAKLLVQHHDPYSSVAVFALEKAQGLSLPRPLIMRNPPWSLFLVFPLGLGSAWMGWLLWLLASTGCVLIAAVLLDVRVKERHLVFLFAPVLACLVTGQSSAFLVLGFALFLRFHRTHPAVAGASLLLMAIKPHLFLVFWAIILVDCIRRRKLPVLVGLASAIAVASGFAMSIDFRVFQQYFRMAGAADLDQEFVPTLSTLLRIIVNTRADWIQFIPSCLALAWGLWYYHRCRAEWNWGTHGMLIMLVSILTAPYAWLPDEIVLLPCVLFALSLPGKKKYSIPSLVAVNCVIIVMLLFLQIPLTSGAFIWTPAFWLAWFLYATSRSRSRKPPLRTPGPEDAQFA